MEPCLKCGEGVGTTAGHLEWGGRTLYSRLAGKWQKVGVICGTCLKGLGFNYRGERKKVTA